MIEKKILITGGAGFIGRNLVEALLSHPKIGMVRIIDDLSTGYLENIHPFLDHPKYENINESITNYDACLKATHKIDYVIHLAALGSVPRSIKNPMKTAEVNILGSVNIMHACIQNGIKKIILACSSSTYGDNSSLPKKENIIGNPLSPYGVSKLSLEQFADVFQKVYDLNYIGLRYFNVFGPWQNPNNSYAAVIPLFCKAYIQNERPVIFGDGKVSRDFTHVDNIVSANLLSLFNDDPNALNQIYNVACGENISLNDLVYHLQKITGKQIDPIYKPPRKGEILHSLADITKIKKYLNYTPIRKFSEGLKTTYQWYSNN